MSRIKHHLSTKAEAIIDGWHGPVIDPNNPWKLSDVLFYGGPNAHDTVYKLEFPEHAGVDQIELVGIQAASDSALNMME